MSDLRGLNLRCAHGSFGWGALDLAPLASGGFALFTHCELGDHYLRPDPRNRARWTIGTTPHAFVSRAEAEAAHAAYLAQEE